MIKVHIVNHTHWDREWYFTTADALVLSENSFTEVLDELERNPKAQFCLDGQSSIIDEYLEVRPERTAQVQQFVVEKRLSIGPWFTQTDAFFVNEESILRNLTLGIRDCKKYGNYMNIGYLPDSFGFNAQMPTLLKNCGIDSMIFYRGIDFNKHVPTPYFRWKGLGEAEVITINLVKGYGGAAFLEDSMVYIQNKLLPVTERIRSLTDLEEILIPVGEDQLDIVVNLPEKLKSISEKTDGIVYEVSSYEDFVDYLKKQKTLPTYTGEFRAPCLSRVHKSIGSIRMDIKIANFQLEQKLLNRVEPLMAIAQANDIHVSEKLLNKAWKKILESHAHDSMGGCVSDNVAVDVLHRMKEADEIVDGIENLILKRFAEKVGLKENEILVFNTLPYAFKGYKKIQIVSATKNIRLLDSENGMILETKYYEARDHVRIVSSDGEKYIQEPPYYKMTLLAKVSLPSMGYKIISFEENVDDHVMAFVPSEEKTIENEFYKIHFSKEGVVLETRFGQKIINFIQFEDCGNDGDTYDFSPLVGDTPILLSFQQAAVEKTSCVERMHLKGVFELPIHLVDRCEPNGKKATVNIDLQLSLIQNTDRIEAVCHVDNQIYSHRLRVKIQTDIFAKETIASVPFGYIRRDVLNGEPDQWQKDYVEIPIDIEPYDASVSVECPDYHVTAFGKGIKEYQYIQDSLYLALFSTTSQLGKEDLLYRPGRASGDTTRQGHVMIETPMAEWIGRHTFEFAFRVGAGTLDEFQTAKIWEDYTMEHVSYQVQTLNKFIYRLDNKIQPRENIVAAPRSYSLLEMGPDVLFSSIGPSLYDDAVLLRIKNPTNQDQSIEQRNLSRFGKVEVVNCIEEVCRDQTLDVKAYDMLTIKCYFNKPSLS